MVDPNLPAVEKGEKGWMKKPPFERVLSLPRSFSLLNSLVGLASPSAQHFAFIAAINAENTPAAECHPRGQNREVLLISSAPEEGARSA